MLHYQMFKFFKKKQPPPINHKNEFIKQLSPPSSDDLLWTTKSGQKLLISEMADSHLQNAHAMMTRRMKVWASLDLELQKRKLKPKDVVFNVVLRPQYWDYLDTLESLSEQDIEF